MPSEDTKHLKIDCDDTVHVVRFSPFELSDHLLAVGTPSQIMVFSCKLEEEKGTLENADVKCIRQIHHGTRVVDISWSPETSLHSVPRVIKLFTAGADKKVRCITSDVKDSATESIVGEHKDYINSIASQPESGDKVASVSDDHTCCVWSTNDPINQLMCFPLTSPGMNVCWHPKEPAKLMVAEKKGIIRFYSTATQQAFMSLDCGHAPLISADWCYANPLQVAALAGSDLFVFDTSQSSQPLQNRLAHSGGGLSVNWSHTQDHLLATTGRPKFQLKVFNIKTNQVMLSVDMNLCSGLNWHPRLPAVAAGLDKQTQLWLVDAK